MANKFESQNIVSGLFATSNWIKRTAGRCLGWVRRIISSSTDPCSNNKLGVGRLTKISKASQVDFRGNWIEFERCIQGLNIGDRVRVLCDDGVLVAEKISQTQLELVHAQATSPLIH